MSVAMPSPHSTAEPAGPRDFVDDESRWQAVFSRNASADGQFYYSVRTTGVYCRPSCLARRPNRNNVRFHATQTEAQQAGFRPCRRCRPQDVPRAAREQETVAAACRRLELAEKPPSLQDLAAAAGLSPSHFHRLFKRWTGVTPRVYATEERARRVRAELAQGASVTQAICEAGFPSHGRFYESATARLGMSPGAYRAGGRGATIRFALGECSLGSVLVAASARGVCLIALGDDPEALVRDLQDRFPQAELIGGDASFDGWVAAVVGLVEQPARGLDLPLDIRGTAFQMRVWDALRRIPAGTTLSYAELAKQLGQPHAARAVGRACGANPLAIAIPCHRVVRTDESLSGYRWGIERKAELLRRERAAT